MHKKIHALSMGISLMQRSLKLQIIISACIAAKIIHDPTITKCIYKIWLADLLSLCFL